MRREAGGGTLMLWMRSRRATWWQDDLICRATPSYSPRSAALRSTCAGGSGSIGTCNHKLWSEYSLKYADNHVPRRNAV